MAETSAPSRQRRSVARLLITLALPVALIVYSVAFWDSVADLRLHSRAYPQSIMVLLALLLVSQIASDIRQWLRSEPDDGLHGTWRRWRPTVYVVAWTLVFIWAMGRLGFYESLTVYVALLLPMIGVRRPLTILLFTVGLVAGIYLLFGVMLSVRLPSGPLVG